MEKHDDLASPITSQCLSSIYKIQNETLDFPMRVLVTVLLLWNNTMTKATLIKGAKVTYSSLQYYKPLEEI